MRTIRLILIPLIFLAACVQPAPPPEVEPVTVDIFDRMNNVAESYVKLVLAVGQHDPDYVDAYYGPPAWRDEAKAEKKSLDAIADRARLVRAWLQDITPPPSASLLGLRYAYLQHQLDALIARVEMLQGKKFSFDQETKALYDATIPHYDVEHYDALLRELDSAVPGDGPLPQRLEAYRRGFVIPNDKLDAVFQAAIHECKARTLSAMELPPGESFSVEYVTNQPWSGYNWYQGKFRSIIQVNTDMPIYIDRAIDLACHEGYPGHHVYNMLLEKTLVDGQGWVEYTVYPLFSPQSLIAEGSANFGIEMAFPGNERTKFESETLFPLAGLDPSTAAQYDRVQALVEKLGYAQNEAARGFLDGTMTNDEALQWLEKYALMSPERAEQRLRFIQRYRSYVINYNYGKDLVRYYVESNGGTEDNPSTRWKIFETLLSTPRVASGLH
ncbi:MAG: hypothetical protein WBX15_06305 [Thermoanaerobaculia bacterium]